MIDLLELENKIINLSQKDLSKFRNWFYEFYNQLWDQNFESDVKTDKLKDLASNALLEYQQGKYTEL